MIKLAIFDPIMKAVIKSVYATMWYKKKKITRFQIKVCKYSIIKAHLLLY